MIILFDDGLSVIKTCSRVISSSLFIFAYHAAQYLDVLSLKEAMKVFGSYSESEVLPVLCNNIIYRQGLALVQFDGIYI
jgi:hypothetical protein